MIIRFKKKFENKKRMIRQKFLGKLDFFKKPSGRLVFRKSSLLNLFVNFFNV